MFRQTLRRRYARGLRLDGDSRALREVSLYLRRSEAEELSRVLRDLLAADSTDVPHSHVEARGDGEQVITVYVYGDHASEVEAAHDTGFAA